MTLPFPILYTFRRCPYAMRARLALYSAKVDHEHREVDLKNKPVEMLAVSPKGTVPVMQLPDGKVVEQSLDIMEWALDFPLMPLEQRRLITENDTDFKQALDQYKYPGKHTGHFPGSSLEQIANNGRTEGEKFLQKLEGQLQPFLTGNVPALIDMAIFPFIRQFTLVDPDWFNAQPYPCLKKWLHHFIASPLFQQVMQTYSAWVPDNPLILVKF